MHRDKEQWNNAKLIEERKTSALKILSSSDFHTSEINTLWQQLNHRYLYMNLLI